MKKRKPVGMAFHWFLPQPFGTEARRSRLDPDDLMKFSHKPHQSSPMFVDLAAPKKAYIKLPDDGTVEVRIRKTAFTLKGDEVELYCPNRVAWSYGAV